VFRKKNSHIFFYISVKMFTFPQNLKGMFRRNRDVAGSKEYSIFVPVEYLIPFKHFLNFSVES